ncbi:MAG: hypothetical protein IIT73_08465, partial [Treponema sp.]|nr:hypothetical protein [Treponema sp.]
GDTALKNDWWVHFVDLDDRKRENAIKTVANIIKKKETDFFTTNLLYHEKVCFTKLFFLSVFSVLFL